MIGGSFQAKTKTVFERLGLLVRKRSRIGGDPFIDVGRLAGLRPVVFDVGANVGQSVQKFQRHTEHPAIHAFEPGRKAFEKLQASFGNYPNVTLNNIGLGSKPGQLELNENYHSVLNSFLEPGRDAIAKGDRLPTGSLTPVSTIDTYCAERHIEMIEILKTDTQGFDLEVLRGAQRMLLAHQIKLLLIELTFVEMYQGAPRCDEVLRFIFDNGFEAVGLYEVVYRNERAGETDALFIDPQFGVR